MKVYVVRVYDAVTDRRVESRAFKNMDKAVRYADSKRDPDSIEYVVQFETLELEE